MAHGEPRHQAFQFCFFSAAIVMWLKLNWVILSTVYQPGRVTDQQFEKPRLYAAGGFHQHAFGRIDDGPLRHEPFQAAESAVRDYPLPMGPSLRGELRRFEPDFFHHVGDRVSHHVERSNDRAAFVHSQVVKLGAVAGGSRSRSHAATMDLDSLRSTVTAALRSGGYSMPLSLGSPPQTFQLMVDTGSAFTWVQSTRCTVCFNQANDDGFQSEISSTYRFLPCSSPICQSLGEVSACTQPLELVPCDYSYRYGNDSVTNGRLSTDAVTMVTTNGSAVNVQNIAFGVATESNVDFEGVDGILGLGQGPLSFPSQLGGIFRETFSYCLQSFADGNASSPIVFGEAAAPEQTTSPYSTTAYPEASQFIQYTPLGSLEMADSGALWAVDLHGFRIGGQPVINVTPEGTNTIIDSGTTMTMLSPEFYLALKSILAETIDYEVAVPASIAAAGLDLCFNLTGRGWSSTAKGFPDGFPEVTFAFELADWTLPWENTFIPVDGEGTWCLAMMPSPVDGLQVLGNVQQANFQIIYDKPNRRLGFVPAKCDAL